MAKDKYTATWISHSSLSDFLTCPRTYFLKNVYRDPKNNHKIQLVSPPLSLGSAVHEVLESLSVLPTKNRFREPLLAKFETAWGKITGHRGGFFDVETEYRYKQRGIKMLKRVADHPGPLLDLAVKIDMDLPYFWLSEEDNIILCGKIDWLEYLASSDSVHIIDFKTSKSEEDPKSLQLPIYHLLVHHCQKRKVTQASYWYLDSSDTPVEKTLPNLKENTEKINQVAKQIKLARQLERFKCPTSGCRHCQPLEEIISGRAEFVGISDFGQDMYVLPTKGEEKREGIVL
ncbi:MAG: PD-(D/E)XK nuclease family protein [Patescibacteria group bacterium]